MSDPTLEAPSPTPWPLLAAWQREAEASPTIRYAHAVTLATSDAEGADARVVLVHRMDEAGLLISSDDASPKARQIRAHPRVALVFHWGPLERQVRMRGAVVEADAEDADTCFAERPRPSRITAWASRQGVGLSRDPNIARQELEAAWKLAEARFEGVDEVPRPDHWRAWRVLPEKIELWQARSRRLHDRLVYERRLPWPEEAQPPGDRSADKENAGEENVAGAAWRIRRLAP